MIKRDDMTFPAEEYERRLGDLRARIAERHLDAVVISDPENIMYLTDYQTTGYSFFQALVVPLEKEPFMITRALEESNVIARTWVEVTRPYPDTGDAIQMLVDALREFGLSNKRIGYERNSYFFPAYHQDVIHTTLKDGKLLDCFGIVEEGRVCKSAVEIELMKKAAFATEAGMAAGIAACHAGATENEIGAAISAGMFCAGGEPPAVMPYVTSGPRTMIGHATWEGRVIQPNEHIFLEVGGCYRRYHTAMMRTVVLGELTDSMYKAQETMKQALNAVHRMVQPGMTVSDVDNMVRNIITDNDIGARLITRSGYSIGIAFPPSWDEGYIVSLKQGESTVLKEGMTFHVIPWMWGVDGDKTCGISDTIYITDDGCRSFFDMDRDFSVKPNDAEKPQLIGINDIKMPKSEPKKPESIELPTSKENAKSAKKKGESYVNS
ncbi:MAG: ectoine hydrolase [Thalassolituus sp.]|jgi:Xaa-Pro dipeptidase|uniref:Xaa-Pro dipeptidase n=2 Tax=root TaxID=1 RepID=A0A160TCA2_9ZZZZ|nr:ectoine hydrolase [Thalassolituus oleivorans]APR67332.1 peptidase M24 [Thalassolituus oleivorans]PCI46964.1 MAG: aminopeptidase P family protein [Oceanospirillales bacterium]PHQ83256.1 MAG: aminopeptidase P family protein [Thalassobium sp.]